MRIVEAKNYKELATKLQYQWAVLLRDTLKKHGTPETVAKAICEDFTFDISMLFDQGEINHERITYKPVVAFSEDDDAQSVLLVQQGDDFQFHEHAYSNIRSIWDLK